MGNSYASPYNLDLHTFPSPVPLSVHTDILPMSKKKKHKVSKKTLAISSMMLSLVSLFIVSIYFTNVENKDTKAVVYFTSFLNQSCYTGFLNFTKESLSLSYQPVEYHMFTATLGNIQLSEMKDFSFMPIENHFGWYLIVNNMNQTFYFVSYVNNQFVLSLSPIENQGFFVGSSLLIDVYNNLQC